MSDLINNGRSSIVRGGTGFEPFERRASDKRALKAMLADRRAVKMVRQFMERSETYRDPYMELSRTARALYENWHSAGVSIIQRANLKLPFGFTIIETEIPQISDIFIKDEKILTYRGRDSKDAMWEDLLTDFTTYQMDQMDFAAKFPSMIRSLLLDGTLIAKVPYRFKEIDVVKRERQVDPVTGETTIVKRIVTETIYDGPDIELIPIYDFYPDWSHKIAGDIQGMRGCVHRTYRTLSSLRNSATKYKNLDEVEKSLTAKGPDAWSPPFFEDRRKEEFEHLNDSVRDSKDGAKIEIWEYWGMFDPRGDGKFEEYIITIANGDVIIREIVNFYDYKFKPFIACPNFVRDNEFYGIPELLSVRSLIKEANAIRNARLDNINLSVNPMWIADRAAGINSKSLYSRANGIIWTNDINGIKPMPIQDPSIGSAQEMQQIQGDIQNATSLINATPSLGQLGKTFGRSATGVNFIQSFASGRIGLKGRLLSNLFFKRMGWIMQMTNRQFVTEDQWVRVSDPNSDNPFEMLPVDAFFRKFDFSIKTDLDTGGPEGEFQKMQAVSQVLQVAEQSQPGVTKFDVVLEALLRPLLGNTVKRFVRSEEERQALVNQQLAGEQMVNAAIGQNAPQPNEEEGPPASAEIALRRFTGEDE